MTLETLEKEVIIALTARMSDEQSARYFYESAAAWCRANGYDKAAEHYEKEAADENNHYSIIRNYFADWGVAVPFFAIPAPPQFESLQDIITGQYGIEFELGEAYEADSLAIFPVCQMSYKFLQQFIQIQNDSIIESASLINKMNNYLKSGDTGLVLFENEVFE